MSGEMRKMCLVETDYLPAVPVGLFEGPWLVFAPHADDETFGMGGAIALARAAGIQVTVLILTDGALGGKAGAADDLVSVREQETVAALECLGGAQVFYWREPDRGLAPSNTCIDRAIWHIHSCSVMQKERSGTLFFPSPVEPHPDHRAAAVIAWEALRRAGFAMQPVSYDISVQGPSNALLDITPALNIKLAAMSVYASQEAQRPYARRVLALNESRSWSLADSVTHAESFFLWPTQDHSLSVALEGLQLFLRTGLEMQPVRVADNGDFPTVTEKADNVQSSAPAHFACPDHKPVMLVVLATDSIGGAEIQTLTLLSGLQNDYRIVLLTHRVVASFFFELKGDDLVCVHFEDFGLVEPFDYNRKNFLAYGRAIAHVARLNDAHIVYSVMHNASLFLALARWRHYNSLKGRCLIGSLHGSPGGFFRQRGSSPSLIERGLIRLALCSLHHVITPSKGVAYELVNDFGADCSKVTSIHNGYDLDGIRQQAKCFAECAGLEKRGSLIVTCCRLTDQKDLHTLVRAFALLQAPSDRVGPEMWIVGDGPMRQQLEAWIDDAGVRNRVHITGFVQNPFPFLAQADVFVLSSHYEGFGNVIVEAMALGVPVVASDCQWGPAELIEHGVSGLLFPVGDVAALHACFEHLLGDLAYSNKLAQTGLRRSAEFNQTTMVESYRALFSMIGSGGE